MTEIIWTAGAGRELQEVFEELEHARENNGVRLMEEVQRMLELLSAQPLMGSYFEKPARKLLIAHRYGIIYSPESRGVIVLSFVDMRRDLQPLRKRIRDWFG
ncbi:type II toxin-antitoxin system RelE/ParE family toxin [Prosthecobacter vanneervenii]|uniref:Plasmid stabilization system protein ParE n=1 Tax=Prosthecobacter vanneervenii TaxID=48466 RepID=A0A7W7YEI0_9BACT|nr:type II toxin-antitoxin system RelE/ParE family toxin [Prosthecobacter vanneervenii]MBB5034649.1 plasmid stabilization system protein ParE [Prosthecobacter vanneervenii]